jgi:large subunit ribosomal protein L11
MSSKPIMTKFKLQLVGGQAPGNAAPILGQNQVNVPQFSQQFNEATKDRLGEVVPCVVTVYRDKTFGFVLKLPPVAELIKKAAGIEKGSPDPLREKKGKLTQAQLEEIANIKMVELNAYDIHAAAKIVAGQARSMGVEVEGDDNNAGESSGK